MPFVTRDLTGAVNGVLRDNPGGAEFLDIGDGVLRQRDQAGGRRHRVAACNSHW